MPENRFSKVLILVLFILVICVSLLLLGLSYNHAVEISNNSSKYSVEFNGEQNRYSFLLKTISWGLVNRNGVAAWNNNKYSYDKSTISRLVVRFVDVPQYGDQFVAGDGVTAVFSDAFFIDKGVGFLNVYINPDEFAKMSSDDKLKNLNGDVLYAIFKITHITRPSYKTDFEKIMKPLSTKPVGQFSYFKFSKI